MKENTGIVVFFPVQPHIYKFLQVKCGEKLVANQKDFYGSVVLDLFSKRGTPLKAFADSLVFPVEVSLRYMVDFGVHIDRQVIFKFNHRMDHIMREEMRTYVSLANHFQHVPKDEAIRQFMLSYNLCEDDIKFETLKKDIGRNVRPDMGTKKILHDLSLQNKP